MKDTIKSVGVVIAGAKTTINLDNTKKMSHIEVKLNNRVCFDIEVDRQGSVIITGGGKVKVLSVEENELIIKINKSS